MVSVYITIITGEDIPIFEIYHHGSMKPLVIIDRISWRSLKKKQRFQKRLLNLPNNNVQSFCQHLLGIPQIEGTSLFFEEHASGGKEEA